MRKIKGSVFLSLDGVMQAPGGPTEDWTGGFDLGGWLPGFFDEVAGETVGAFFGGAYDLLLGRKTYDIFAAYWPYATGENAPMGEAFTQAGKYILTHSDAPLEWQNSHRLGHIEEIATLKKTSGPDLLIQGSSKLYPQLLTAGLLDRLTILTFPVVLGKGKRLFGDGTPMGAMKMLDHKVSPKGTVIATYEPAGQIALASFGSVEPNAREAARQERMEQEG